MDVSSLKSIQITPLILICLIASHSNYDCFITIEIETRKRIQLKENNMETLKGIAPKKVGPIDF